MCVCVSYGRPCRRLYCGVVRQRRPTAVMGFPARVTLAVCVYAVMLSLCVGPVATQAQRHATAAKSLHVHADKERGPIVADRSTTLLSAEEDVQDRRKRTLPHDLVKVITLNDSHQQLMVHWVGEGSNVIMCLARDPSPRFMSQPSAVYISYNYGESFEKIDQFKLNFADGYAMIDKFYYHPKVISHSVFADTTNKVLFTTSNFGRNFTQTKVNFVPSDVSFYEYDPHTFLVHDKSSDGRRKLWLTQDFGKTWTEIQESVKAFFWSSSVDPDVPTMLYVEREEPSGSSSILASERLFRDDTFSIVFTEAKDFQIKGDFMFATKAVDANNLDLYMSHKRGPFVKAQFQSELDRRIYYIADVSDDQVMVVVSHTNSLANLYISKKTDGNVVQFALSLERIVCYFPNSTWADTWLDDVTDEAFADLYKVEGLRGIYIASQVVPYLSTTATTINPEHLSTVITFDHGAEWNRIRPPVFDDQQQPIMCNMAAGCSLHLSQKFNQLYPATRSVPILSSKSAPGLIMATGTVGASLKGRPGVFVSTNAGLTWRQVLKDYYFFNFGDHGGVMVAVKYFKSQGETRELLYSTDEGETWKNMTFSDEDLRMYGLMTEPGENTTIFTMFGSARGAHQWLIVKVDLRDAFDRKCEKDDYKFWSPSSAVGPHVSAHVSCVMGRREIYEKRIARANCYNGIDYDRPMKIEICECFAEDFDCDFGFLRTLASRECVRNRTSEKDPYMIPNTCKPGEFYTRTKGYVKIPGDPCQGGNETLYLPDRLPCPVKEKAEFLLFAQRDRIAMIDLATNELQTLPIENLRNVIAVEFDMRNNCVYWADIVTDTIGRVCLDSGEREILVQTNLSSIEGMALDWVSNHLYFVDGMRSMIEIVRTDLHDKGRMRRTILGPNKLKKPRGIAVHPVQGFMFWTDWALGDPSVNRANLDGSNIKRLFESPIVRWPNGITIDHIAERIYWVDAREDYIASANLDGRNYKKIIANDERVLHPFAVAVFKDLMYWDDWRQNSIFQADKDHGLGIIALYTQFPGLMDLKVFAHSIQEGTNRCSNRNKTGCSYLCMGMPQNEFVCHCPDEMIMVGGECLCLDHSKPTDGKCNRTGHVCSSQYFSCKNGACIPNLWKCDGDNDCGDSSDEDECSPTTCEVNEFRCDDGKCIPPYWRCDFDIDCSDYSDETHCKYQECKVNSQFKCANGRCIPKTWRCDMEDDCKDGSDEKNCVLPTTTPCKPMESKCHNTSQCIPNTWFCDGQEDCMDGSDEEKCKNTTCKTYEFKCKNNHCISAHWVCDGENDCHDDEASDEKNCTTPTTAAVTTTSAPKPCSDWMFTCNNKKCIPYWWKCDHVDDCGDKSDEYGCGSSSPVAHVTTPMPTNPTTEIQDTHCPKYHFQCDTGECILESWLCDKMHDCSNGEDEKNCKDVVHCREQDFRCRFDGSCIPLNKLCNGVADCPDGTDEYSCTDIQTTASPKHNTDSPLCPVGLLPCDFNRCVAKSLFCDGHQDCSDQTDESHCSNFSKVLQVMRMAVDPASITESSFVLHWQPLLGMEDQVVYMPSIAEIGNMNSAWINISQWSKDSTYTFKNLSEYTTYNITVYARNSTGYVFPAAKYIKASTGEGVPSPPWQVQVQQLSGRRVQVQWQFPTKLKGNIKSFTVYNTPPIPPQSKTIEGMVNHTIVESAFEGGNNYSFWVQAENGKHMSNWSNVVSLVFDGNSIIEPIQGLVIQSKTNRSITLSWKAVQKAIGYHITPKCSPPFPNLPRIDVVSNINYVVGDLAPGTTYNFEVSAYTQSFEGPVSTVTAKTEGSPLPTVSLAKPAKQGTSVFLQWKAPKDMRTANWTYGVYYAQNMKDLFTGSKATTSSLNYTLTGLMACESYILSVGVVGPFGVGPLPLAFDNVLMDFDITAAPKNVKVSADPNNNTNMIVTWNSSCPSMSNKIAYEIIVREVNFNRKSSVTPLATANTSLFHLFHVHYGGQYEVQVQTATPNAVPSPVVRYSAPPIPGPHKLKVFTSRNGSFIIAWNDRKLPEALQNVSYMYKVLVSPGNKLDAEGAKQYRVQGSPVTIGDVQEGAMYTIAVVLETHDGYQSLMSEEVTYVDSEKDLRPAYLTSTQLASVVVPVVLVVIALSGTLFFFVMRHRRLQRSFVSFANSHYDTRSGAATFSGGDGLDEEDSPVIRGFSDDEPLVIA